MKTSIIFKHFFFMFTLVMLLIFSVSANVAAARPDEAKIIAYDGAEFDTFGGSVSISGDYAIVGAEYDDDNATNSGSAYIFKKDETGWIQQAKLTANDDETYYDVFGGSVSISGDYAIVGAVAEWTESGSAYIFKRDGTVWTQQAKLTTSDWVMGDIFGMSVSISGNYAIVGDVGHLPYGSAYIFKRDGTSWIQHAKLTPSDGANYDGFACSVSISGDYAIVGAMGDDPSGSAYIFKRDGTVWTHQSKLTAGDATDYFGCSVSISGDYTIVGSHSGSYIFKMDGTSWIQQAMVREYDSASSVSVSGDYAVVGNTRYKYGDKGWAYIFERNGTIWNEVFRLTASDGQEGNYFGSSVGISDGHAIIGTPKDDYNGYKSGSAYIYCVTPHTAEIYSPAPGLTLNSANTTFRWNDSGADRYWLWIGTSPGSNDLNNSDQGTNTSATISGLPTNGEALYVRLWSKEDGEWVYKPDCIYIAYNSASDIQTPASGSTLNSTTETFAWSNAGTEQYWLWVGTSEGGNDLYNKDMGTDTSATISALPVNGETLYVRLWSKVSGKWLYKADSTYTACNKSSSVAEILSPASGSTLGSTTETFAWNDTGAEQYWLWIGTSAGSNDLANLNQETNTSATVSGLPNTGETLYVRLWSKVSGEWLYKSDSAYTATEP
ncbi:MAG: hypothetical protein GY795_00695 [Desulfobacterales bacterium]|nr:hypothetical protein [Desulfobacterales bacterium]